MSAAASLWADTQARLKAMEAVAETACKRLLDLAGEGSARGAGVTVTRYWAKGTVDYGKVPALKGFRFGGHSHGFRKLRLPAPPGRGRSRRERDCRGGHLRSASFPLERQLRTRASRSSRRRR